MTMSVTSWLYCLLPSYWLTKIAKLIPSGMELEKLAILFIGVILLPTILGAILGIIWNVIWVIIVGLLILLGSVIIFKALLPQTPCSSPDIIISILISAGLYIPTLVLDGISNTMSIANSKRESPKQH